MSFITKSPEGKYKAHYRDPSGKQRAKTFTLRGEAKYFLDNLDVDLADGRFIDPKRGLIRFGDWAEEWSATIVNLRPSTLDRDLGYLRRHILPCLEDIPLSKISPLEVRKWVAMLDAEGLAPATVQKDYQILGKIMRAAVDSGLIGVSPCRGIKLRPIEQKEMRFLTPPEVARLANVIDQRYRAFVLTSAYGGLRWGELVALKHERFDPGTEEVEVVETIVELNGQLLPPGPPKTKAGRRSVKLPHSIADELSAHIKLHKIQEGELLFQAPNGGPLRKTFRRRFWLPAVQAAGLAPLRIHDLRHTAIALWIAVGADPKRIAVRAGHTSVAVVLDRYGHLFPEGEERLAERLDVVFRAAAPPRMIGAGKVRELPRSTETDHT